MARRRCHPLEDLFGEIPVSLDELLAWMLAVPGIPPTSPRFAYYVRHYHVIAKIQGAKREGTFEAAVRSERAPAPGRLASLLELSQATALRPPAHSEFHRAPWPRRLQTT